MITSVCREAVVNIDATDSIITLQTMCYAHKSVKIYSSACTVMECLYCDASNRLCRLYPVVLSSMGCGCSTNNLPPPSWASKSAVGPAKQPTYGTKADKYAIDSVSAAQLL